MEVNDEVYVRCNKQVQKALFKRELRYTVIVDLLIESVYTKYKRKVG